LIYKEGGDLSQWRRLKVVAGAAIEDRVGNKLLKHNRAQD